MATSEETNHDILLVITVALVILFIANLGKPDDSRAPILIPAL